MSQKVGCFIHDYRYLRYVTADAELTLAADVNHSGNGPTV
jgi:hypothetical protein